MKYPLDVEICVKAFIEENGHKETSIKFMRAYVTTLNDFYNEGLCSSVTVTAEEVFNIKNYDLKKSLKESYEEFLKQAKDAYNQGLIDACKSTSSIHTQGL